MKHGKIIAEVASPDCDNHVWLHLECEGRSVNLNLGDATAADAQALLELAGLSAAPPVPAECADAEAACEANLT